MKTKTLLKKRIIFSFVVLCLLSVLFTIPLQAADVTLTIDNSIVLEGSNPVFTYTGTSEKDWIGIYEDERLPGDGASLVWAYTSDYGQPDGKMDFTETIEGSIGFFEDLWVGKYVAYLCENDGYTILAEVAFEIVEELPAEPIAEPEPVAEVKEPEPEPEAAPQEEISDTAPVTEEQPAANAPQTSDKTICIAFFASIAAAGLIITYILKRKAIYIN